MALVIVSPELLISDLATKQFVVLELAASVISDSHSVTSYDLGLLFGFFDLLDCAGRTY